ncbi:phosphodiesterase [Blastococcus sp. SYSU D00669]
MAGGGRRRAGLPEAAGRLVGAPLGALARWRQGKPMHPRGVVFDGELERGTGTEPFGVPWLDEPARDRVVVRLSRGAGLPPALPDLLGLAVRIPDGPVDLLLSTTGTAPLLRLLPTVRRDPAAAYTSIMGYRSDAGTLRLAAFPDGGSRRFTLAAARGQGPWRLFGRLALAAPRAPLDPDVRFDAVRHPPHGLLPDGPMARFRAPAYAAARAGRDAPPPALDP